MLLWRPRFSTTLTILSGRSYTEQGGWPIRHSQRHNGTLFRLNEALDNAETGVDLKATGPNPAEAPTSLNVLPGTVLLCESEKMLVTSVSGATATVTRAYAGTTGVAHADGTNISVFTTGDGVVDMTGVAWGSIIFPAAWTAANLACFTCDTRDGTFVPCRDETGALIQVTGIATGAANEQILPAKFFPGGSYKKFRSITVGTDPTSAVTQAADRSLIFAGGE